MNMRLCVSHLATCRKGLIKSIKIIIIKNTKSPPFTDEERGLQLGSVTRSLGPALSPAPTFPSYQGLHGIKLWHRYVARRG